MQFIKLYKMLNHTPYWIKSTIKSAKICKVLGKMMPMMFFLHYSKGIGKSLKVALDCQKVNSLPNKLKYKSI
jgi:hypothetical protein